MSQVGFIVASGASVTWALVDASFRGSEGLPNGAICLPLALAISFLSAALSVSGPARRSGLWFALFLSGQAAALQLIEAGPLVRYQHYGSLGEAEIGFRWLVFSILLLQAAAVLGTIARHRSDLWRWLSRSFRRCHLALMLGLLIVSSAAISRDIPGYFAELALAICLQAISLANLILLGISLPEKTLAAWKGMLGSLEHSRAKEHWSEIRRVEIPPVVAAIAVTILTATLSFWVYERHPHLQDEVIYLYHARYFSEGQLTVAAPKVPEAFTLYMIPRDSERWYSIFPPGWPAILSLGVHVGAAWLVNPLLAGVNVLLMFLLLSHLYDRRAAVIGSLLLAVSPWALFLGMSFMAHTSFLTAALLAALASARFQQAGGRWLASVAGGLVGTAMLIRPFDGLILGALLGLWIFCRDRRELKIAASLAFVCGVILVGSVLLPYNYHLTGSIAKMPLATYYDEYFGPKVNALGFGPGRGMGWPIDAFPGHSPFEALINAALNLSALNTELFGWACGSLVLIALIVVSRTLQRIDWYMILVVLLNAGALSFYWFSGGPDFGARYWYLMIIPLIALAVRGMEFLEDSLSSAFSNTGRTRVQVVLFALITSALVNFLPWRALDKYHSYLGMTPGVRILEKHHRLEGSLVLIQGERFPDYASAWVYNPPDLRGESPIYAWDGSSEIRQELLAAYPDRAVWLVRGPSRTGTGYEVIAGPVTRAELSPENPEP